MDLGLENLPEPLRNELTQKIEEMQVKDRCAPCSSTPTSASIKLKAAKEVVCFSLCTHTLDLSDSNLEA